MGVFGHRFHGDTAHLFQRAALDDGARATEESGIPQVVAVLYQAVEQLAFVGYRTESIEISLERVGREEKVRRLQHHQLRILEEPAHAHLQERAGRHVIGIEDGNVFARGLGQGEVEVAGLGVIVIRPNDVADTGHLAELAELGATAVIEYVDVELVLRPVDGLGSESGELDDIQRLVVGRDVHIHGRPQAGITRQGIGFALQRPGRLHVAQQQDQQGIELGQHQAIAKQHVQQVVEAQRRSQAPVHVTQRGNHREHDHRQDRQAVGPTTKQQRSPHARRTEQHLLLHIQRRSDDHPHQAQCQERQKRLALAIREERIHPGGRRERATLRQLESHAGCSTRVSAVKRCSKACAQFSRSRQPRPFGSYSSTLRL